MKIGVLKNFAKLTGKHLCQSLSGIAEALLKPTQCRSSRSKVFCNKAVFKKFAKVTGKHLSQNLFFNKVAGLRPATSLKKRFWHRLFLKNFAKFLRAPFLQNTSSGCFWTWAQTISLSGVFIIQSNSTKIVKRIIIVNYYYKKDLS